MIEPKIHKKNSAVIMTSRIRLARNLAGLRFSNAADSADLSRVFEKCAAALAKTRKFKGGTLVKMSEISDFGKGILLEERHATHELVRASEHAGVFISKDGTASAMINEEDHLRIQAVAKGQCLNAIWRVVNAIDDSVEADVEYAFGENIGYLTACPTNVGTGMRASLMMHLPALVISEQIEKIVRGLNQLGMVMRGANGEGSDSYGAFFQLSNQQTLGMSEGDIIKKIIKFGGKLVEFETNARLKLLQQNPIVLVDKFSRSIAILKNCKLIDTAEAISLLSNIRLAADMGFCKNPTSVIESVDAAMLDVQPSHLQQKFNIRESEAGERDAVRASFLNGFADKLPEISVK